MCGPYAWENCVWERILFRVCVICSVCFFGFFVILNVHYCVLFSGQARSETCFTLDVKGSDVVMLVSNGNHCPAPDSPRKKSFFLSHSSNYYCDRKWHWTHGAASPSTLGVFLGLYTLSLVIQHSENKNWEPYLDSALQEMGAWVA